MALETVPLHLGFSRNSKGLKMLIMTKKQIMRIRLQTWNAYALAFKSNIPYTRLYR